MTLFFISFRYLIIICSFCSERHLMLCLTFPYVANYLSFVSLTTCLVGRARVFQVVHEKFSLLVRNPNPSSSPRSSGGVRPLPAVVFFYFYNDIGICVRVPRAVCRVHAQENDMRRGRIWSCTRFIAKMDSLRNHCHHYFFCSIYTHDVQFSIHPCNLPLDER